MNNIISNLSKIGGQKQGVDYIRQVYNVSYNKALSLYRKAEYQLAQQTTLHQTDVKAFQRYVARTIEGTTQVKANINLSTSNISLSNVTVGSDIFKLEVQQRLNKFMNKYAGTDIYKIYEAYMNDTVYIGKMYKYSGKKITYDQLKNAVEDFKRNSYEYLIGS